MKIVGKEIVAADGKWLHRIESDAYFRRCTLLPGETEANFEEVAKLPDSDLEEVRSAKLAEIVAYDTSAAVNEFYLAGAPMWLDKATRVGLMNSTQIEKAAGHSDTTLWFGTQSITIGCDKAIEMLSALEMYALDCYNKTAEHKAKVSVLGTVAEIEGYDYTTGYPEKLRFEL